MTIDRSHIFTLAWKSAKAQAAGYPTLRASFAAALRRVWGLVKAMVAENARYPARPVRPVAPTWETENIHRAAAVAAQRARLGTYAIHCW